MKLIKSNQELTPRKPTKSNDLEVQRVRTVLSALSDGDIAQSSDCLATEGSGNDLGTHQLPAPLPAHLPMTKWASY